MRKPIEDKTPLAAWATLSREEAGMSVEEVVDALGERGHVVRAATIRGIEGGSKGASVRLRRLLADVYGVKPPGQKETGSAISGEAGLVEAILAQTQAINALVAALQGGAVEARLRAVEAGVALLAQRADVELPEQDAPPVGAGSGE